MRWRPKRPWFGPSPWNGKIRPVSWQGYLVLGGSIALVLGLTRLGQVLPHLLIIVLAVAVTVASLLVMVATYGPPAPGRPRSRRCRPTWAS